jgi:hypothetical protein
VYVDHSDKPSLRVKKLNNRHSGLIGSLVVRAARRFLQTLLSPNSYKPIIMKKLILMLALFAAVKTQAQQKYQVHNLSVINPKQWIIPKNDTLDYELALLRAKSLDHQTENSKLQIGQFSL